MNALIKFQTPLDYEYSSLFMSKEYEQLTLVRLIEVIEEMKRTEEERNL
jgi:hypothetical protein